MLSEALLLQFLLWLRDHRRLASQTIAAYKSALTLPLREAFGLDLCSPRFSLLLKSLFLSRPPVRRPQLRWDLGKVLRLLRRPEFRLPRASLPALLARCLVLTALATGNRVSEIAALSREGSVLRRDGSLTLAIRPGFLYKNQSARRTPPPVSVRPLPGDSLCPVAALQEYIRSSTSVDGHLFTHPVSHRPLNRGQISGRVCRLIHRADPTGIPQMHDLRRAAASIAWTRGVPTSQIVQSAFWSSPSVFIRRYLRDCPETSCVALNSV